MSTLRSVVLCNRFYRGSWGQLPSHLPRIFIESYTVVKDVYKAQLIEGGFFHVPLIEGDVTAVTWGDFYRRDTPNGVNVKLEKQCVIQTNPSGVKYL